VTNRHNPDPSELVHGLPSHEKMLEALGGLWCKFGELELIVHHVLTEPVCPTATIRFEFGPPGFYFRTDMDTIDEAVKTVVAAAYITLIERRPKPDTFPVGERDEDKNLAAVLAAIDEIKERKKE